MMKCRVSKLVRRSGIVDEVSHHQYLTSLETLRAKLKMRNTNELSYKVDLFKLVGHFRR